jgi:hypothetical protein
MKIARRIEREDDGYVRLTNFKKALINMLGLDMSTDLSEEQLLELVKRRLEDRYAK